MIKLFFSYSHADEQLRNELEKHLSLLKREGTISTWHDRCIAAGGHIDQEISEELEASQIILLLISSDFIASDYCYEREMMRALEKDQEGSAVVIPVILRSCDWHKAPFGKLKAVPTDGKPITMYSNHDDALTIVTKEIRALAESFSVSGHTELDKARAASTSTRGIRSSNLRIKKKFSDYEKDQYLELSFDFISDYFEQSLNELSVRNPEIETRFKRNDAASFSAYIYEAGEKRTECSVYYGGSSFGSGISYSQSADVDRNSYNEQLSIVDDGYILELKPFGMHLFGSSHQGETLSQQGAAEYYWGMFIHPLQ